MTEDVLDEASFRAALSILGRRGAAASWQKTKDRTARTAPARAALNAKFLAAADGDPERAAALRADHYRDLARKSAASRRAKKQADTP